MLVFLEQLAIFSASILGCAVIVALAVLGAEETS